MAKHPQPAPSAPVIEHDTATDAKMAEGGSVTTTENETTVGAVGDAQATGDVAQGVRARRAFMLKQLLPNPDWINKNVVAGGKGTRATIGRVYGVVTSTSRKTNTLPDGSTSQSIACNGVVSSESYVTGEISEASTAYLPMAYAEKLEALFKSQPDVKVIEVDCDVGIEATGKAIPYEWIIVAFREGEEMAVMKRLKNSRPRPAQLVLTGPKD